MFILVVILLLILLILLTKINFIINYDRSKDNEQLLLMISIFNNLIKFKIPKKISKEEKKLDFKKLKNNIKRVYNSYSIYKNTFKKILMYIKYKTKCKQFEFKIEFGLGDAALTGITGGLIYGTIYNILALMNNYIILPSTKITVNPDYNNSKLNIKFKGIFTIRIVHIINMLFILLFSFIKALFTKKGFYESLKATQ